MIRADADGIRLLHVSEACRLKVYLDSGCLPTVGWGHLIRADEFARFGVHPDALEAARDFRAAAKAKNKAGMAAAWEVGKRAIANCISITQAMADAMFEQDLRRFELGVVKLVEVGLNQQQANALLSFSYNVGLGMLKSSTLLRQLNAGSHDSVPGQMARFTFANGKYSGGLKTRRLREIDMWNGVPIRWPGQAYVPPAPASKPVYVPDEANMPVSSKPIPDSHRAAAAGSAIGNAVAAAWVRLSRWWQTKREQQARPAR